MPKSIVTIWGVLAAIILFVLALLGIVVIQGDSISSAIMNNSTQDLQTLHIKIIDQNGQLKNFAYDFNLRNTNSLKEIFDTLDATSPDFDIEYDTLDQIKTLNGFTPLTNQSWNIKLNGKQTSNIVNDIVVKPSDTIEISLS